MFSKQTTTSRDFGYRHRQPVVDVDVLHLAARTPEKMG